MWKILGNLWFDIYWYHQEKRKKGCLFLGGGERKPNTEYQSDGIYYWNPNPLIYWWLISDWSAVWIKNITLADKQIDHWELCEKDPNVMFWPFDPAKNAIQGDAQEGSDTFWWQLWEEIAWVEIGWWNGMR